LYLLREGNLKTTFYDLATLDCSTSKQGTDFEWWSVFLVSALAPNSVVNQFVFIAEY
jgi:hypothetical protein